MTLPDLLTACNLSQAQAADLLGVGLRTVHRWCAGQTKPRKGVIDALEAYAKRVARAREELSNSVKTKE